MSEEIIKTGLKPFDTRCIVQIKKASAKTKSGLCLPDSHVRRETLALQSGILVKKGINAFQDIREPEERPQIGDRVLFVRYAGVEQEIPDNDDYIFRIVQDADIFAGDVKIEEEGE